MSGWSAEPALILHSRTSLSLPAVATSPHLDVSTPSTGSRPCHEICGVETLAIAGQKEQSFSLACWIDFGARLFFYIF